MKLYPRAVSSNGRPRPPDDTASVVRTASEPYSMTSYRRLRLILGIALLLTVTGTLRAQIVTGDGPRYPGTTGDPAPVDTTALREGRIRTEETSGLYEGPIDPNVYRVGPADVLTISIVSARPIQQDLEVSPDGRLLIQGVGAVDVRGRTLSQVERAVADAVARTYHSASVAVALRRMRKFKVNVTGAVLTPSAIVAAPTTRVSEAIALAGGASSQAEMRRISVRHADGRTSMVDLLPFYSLGERTANPPLEDGDVVIVPFQDENAIVQVFGAVQREGEYTFNERDSISSIIRYAMGPTADADRDSVEVVSVDESGVVVERSIHRLGADGSVSDDRALRPGDRVFVRGIGSFRKTDRVVVTGEVAFPGSYAIERGRTRLYDVLQQAGGVTPDASLDNASLFRRRLAGEPDPRLASINEIDPEKRSREEIDYRRQKIRELNRPGEMTVDFAALMRGDQSENLVLMDNDSVHVPETKGVIRVAGKVNNPGAVTYHEGMTYREYVELAGGFGWRADDGATEIVKEGSGEVFLASNDDSYRLEPGDQIWVPEEKPAEFWEGFTTVMTIAAQVATIIAVVVSIRASNAN